MTTLSSPLSSSLQREGGASRRGSFQEALSLLQEEAAYLPPLLLRRGSPRGVQGLRDLLVVLSLLQDTTVSADAVVAVTFKTLLKHYGGATFDEVPTRRDGEGALLLQEGALAAWAAPRQEVFAGHEDLLPLFEPLVEEHLASRGWGKPGGAETFQDSKAL